MVPEIIIDSIILMSSKLIENTQSNAQAEFYEILVQIRTVA
jgi:hypothetical protein